VADDKWSKYEVTTGTDKWDKYAQEDAVPTEEQQVANLPKMQTPLPPGLQPTERAMQYSMGGMPQFVDVPKGTKQAYEAAGKKGMATGAGIGLGLLAVPQAIAAPLATAGAAVAGYGLGKAAKYGSALLGAGEVGQMASEYGGNILGGVAGGAVGAGINAGVRRMVAGKVWIQQPNGSWVADPWADALTFGTKIGKAILNHLAPKPAQDLAMADAYAATRAVQRQAARNALVSKTPLGPEAPPPAAPPEMFPGATPSNIPVGNAQLPPATQGAQQPPAFVSKFQPPQTPQPSKLVLPGSTPPPVKVTYQSVPRKKLYEMAQTGDIQAGLELIRNPKGFELPPNFKYLIEESAKKMPWRNQPE
jgi:hypothetical protein